MSTYLSIVVTSRNDNHGGDMTRRMSIFVKGLIDQCNKFNLSAELIFVEWNPPADKPLLHEVLPQPQPGDKLTLRYIVVPETIHKQYFHSYSIPLFQMIAKNVGIRRAKGQFILATNIDLLFSDALMEELAKKNFETGKFYRCNRCDVPASIADNISTEEQLIWCEKNVIARLGYDIKHINMSGFPFTSVYKVPALSKSINYLLGKVRQRLHPFRFMMSKIDYEACGDFTMMSKKDWLAIEGYVEMDLYSIHVDSMALNACLAQGMEQVLYPPKLCTYHIDHKDGWSSMSGLAMLKFLQHRPGMDSSVMHGAGREIILNKTNYGINKPDWGFAQNTFEEFVFNPL